MTAVRSGWPAQLLHYWFHQLRPDQWFGPSDIVDAQLNRRFGRTLAGLAQRPAREFLRDPLTARAAVLLFDQLPRNLYRNSPQAFASDPLAREILRGAKARGWDRGLGKSAPVPVSSLDAQRSNRRSGSGHAPVPTARRCKDRSLCPCTLPDDCPLRALPAPQCRTRPDSEPGRKMRSDFG